MIMLAKVVPYGGNAVRYALDKEKAKLVKVNYMPEGIDPTAIWYMMKHHCQLHQQDRTVGRKLERLMVQFVISPSKEEAANFTMNDWANLQDESLLHLHMDCCRVDLDGNTNDVHDIHKRAMMAAEIINMRHGWKQPKEIRDMRREEIVDFCEYTLQKMQEFDIDFYFKMLRMKGYEVTPRYDKDKKLVGYTIGKNASVFKASEIGRKFMASQLEATWKKFHPKPAQAKVKPSAPTVTLSSRPVRPTFQTTASSQPKVQPSVQPKPTPAKTVFNIDTGSEIKKVWIPNSVKDIFFNEAQVPEGNDTATVEKVQLDEVNIAHTAMLLFAGYIDAATSMSESCGGGGGSAPESDWGKKDDEDERMFARRCLLMAHSMYKPKSVKRGFHR